MRLRAVFWLLLAITAATRLMVATADYRNLIALDILQDDAFYYFTIARNLAGGRGITFDGVIPTNGFHPLHLVLLVPLMVIAGEDLVLPIRAAGLLATLLAAGTGLLVYALTRQLASARVALVALALWAVTPYFVFMGLNGLETGLAICSALAVLVCYLRCIQRAERASVARLAGFGALCGLSVLARVDLVLLLVALALDWISLRLRRRSLGGSLPGALVATAACLAVWLPWGITSRAATGAWLPTSGEASRQIALNYGWGNLEPFWGPVQRSDLLFDPERVPAQYHADVATKQALVFLFVHPLLAPLRFNVPFDVWPHMEDYLLYRGARRSPPLALAVLLLAIAAIAIRGRRQVPARFELSRPALGGILASYSTFMFLGYVFIAPAHWYFSRYLALPVLLTTLYGLARLGDRIAPSGDARSHRRVAAIAAVLVVVTLQVVAFWHYAAPRLDWSDAPAGGFLRSWRALEPRIDRTRRVGAFQAGIYGYFSGLDVVNLDGKVNPDALRALREKRLHRYIDEMGVDYIVDWEGVLFALCTRHMPPGDLRFTPIATDRGVTLFRVERKRRRGAS